MNIYLDNASTTHIVQRVINAMQTVNDSGLGNASSLHKQGVKAATYIENARELIAAEINADPEEIIFTSSGTESNNTALKGAFFAWPKKNKHVIVSRIEHPSILETVNWLEKNGAVVTYLPVNNAGFIDPEDVAQSITENTVIVSVMHANNEIGTLEPVKEIGTVCKEKNVLFHTDACQSFKKAKLDVREYNLDLVTINAHKLHGPTGVGALFIRKGTHIAPLLHGGGQENGLRSGTYNTTGIVGFATAVESTKPEHILKMKKLRNFFLKTVNEHLEDVYLNGPSDQCLCNIINLRIKGIKAKDLMFALNEQDIFVSTGSSCSSTKLEPSHVLLAIGLDATEAEESIRISLSRNTKKEDMKAAADILIRTVKNMRGKA